MPTSQIIDKFFDKLKFGVYVNGSENYFMGNPYYHRLKIKKFCKIK
jgi:hypothetical protein